MLGCLAIRFDVMPNDRSQRTLSYLVLVALACALAFRLWSCSSTPGVKIAQRAVAHFRSQMEAGQFQAIYAEADDGIRQKHNVEDFVRLMAAIERGVGALKETRLNRAQESWFSRRDKYVTLTYQTTWDRTKGEERFIFVIRQGQATLDSYKVIAPYPTLLSLP
jgi:hypothetical protein